MATSTSSQAPVIPRLHRFELVQGMQLQMNVCGSCKGRNVRLDFQLSKCSSAWILHWGCVFPANMNWFIPNSGLHTFKQGSLQTPFTKKGELYLLTIELRDPNIHAIEFVLKDGSRYRWLKLNHGNFRVEIPESDPTSLKPSVLKELIERKAFLVWESKGRPMSSPQQQKQDYEDTLIEIQNHLAKGISLNELHSSLATSSTKRVVDNREQLRTEMMYSYKRKHKVEQWLHKHTTGPAKNTMSS